ncbi:MAG: DUF1934 domain-containing protein [Oscillospiraceae bacterium]|nr:DUF1934 domain-containing protein [Oscillospiraceae bacterium]
MKDVLLSIIGKQETGHDDDEGYELITDGEYSFTPECITISYIESELTGFQKNVRTTFTATGDTVTLSRTGGFSGDMVFCEGQKHYFVYDTPYGSFTMGVETHTLTAELDENGGELYIDYVIDVENIVVSKNIFRIVVK